MRRYFGPCLNSFIAAVSTNTPWGLGSFAK